MVKDSKLKYATIRMLNILLLFVFLFLVNLEGAEYVGLYLFYTIYLWLFIILAVVEIRLLIMNKKNLFINHNRLTSDGWFLLIFICSFILIVWNIKLLTMLSKVIFES